MKIEQWKNGCVLVAARNACKITVVKRIRLHLMYEYFGTKLEIQIS